ncbi:hypothetical protein KsCSTR_44980 [Candidatus Kuenenia stuttgartiensis]|uniref:Uncharacterized protein n=1 Tax=Kuenenia stuttgartiensis TaxID=174633 RepID=A0A6G7GXE0_KUEST|nr:hypothetical protein KsCSTR_44980 [Candidatus Kuenenia stuttgartiensis]
MSGNTMNGECNKQSKKMQIYFNGLVGEIS